MSYTYDLPLRKVAYNPYSWSAYVDPDTIIGGLHWIHDLGKTGKTDYGFNWGKQIDNWAKMNSKERGAALANTIPQSTYMGLGRKIVKDKMDMNNVQSYLRDQWGFFKGYGEAGSPNFSILENDPVAMQSFIDTAKQRMAYTASDQSLPSYEGESNPNGNYASKILQKQTFPYLQNIEKLSKSYGFDPSSKEGIKGPNGEDLSFNTFKSNMGWDIAKTVANPSSTSKQLANAAAGMRMGGMPGWAVDWATDPTKRKILGTGLALGGAALFMGDDDDDDGEDKEKDPQDKYLTGQQAVPWSTRYQANSMPQVKQNTQNQLQNWFGGLNA